MFELPSPQLHAMILPNTEEHMSSLTNAFRTQCLAMVKDLIKSYPELLDCEWEHGDIEVEAERCAAGKRIIRFLKEQKHLMLNDQALHLSKAFEQDSLGTVKSMTESFPALLYRHYDGHSVVTEAARCGAGRDIIEHLLSNATVWDINGVRGGDGMSPLMFAIVRESLELAEAVLNHPMCDPNARVTVISEYDDFGGFPIYNVTAFHEVMLVQDAEKRAAFLNLLVRYGADPNMEGANSINFQYATPLMAAAYYGLIDVVEQLIGIGVDIDASDSYGEQTALRWAVDGVIDKCHSKAEILIPLIAAGADINARTNGALESSYVTPALRACYYGDSKGPALHKMAKILIEAGCDVNAPDYCGQTLIHCAVSNSWLEIIDMVLERGGRIDLMDYRGQSLMRVVVSEWEQETDLQAVKKLFDVNCDVQNCDLMKAALQTGNFILLPYLLAAGCTFVTDLDRYKNHVLFNPKVFSWLKSKESQPLSLMELCRIRIRHALPVGCPLKRVLSQMSLPREMIEYIMLNLHVDFSYVS